MIRINNLRLPLDGEDDLLRKKAAAALGVSPFALGRMELVRKSIDARKKNDIHFVCSVRVEAEREGALLRRIKSPHIFSEPDRAYQVLPAKRRPDLPPVIVGMGPAGLFCALALSYAGIPSILLDRGRPVEARSRDVERFWQTGLLDPESNVQFGEGGAGTFSDGKLTSGIGDPRVGWVLNRFVEAGAPADILYQQKPHIGTDILRAVVRNLRITLQKAGCAFYYEHQFSGFALENGALRHITVKTSEGEQTLGARQLVLAPGHSARDTFRMLHEAGVAMMPKSFAIGVRAEHRQKSLSRAQFGAAAERLPAVDYKLACHLPNGRSVFSFCVCPGGDVVAAASQPGHLVTNGMSLRARDGETINGGILVGVSPEDYPGSHPLSGVLFQETWERAAFQLGGGNFRAPVQLLEDFLAGIPSGAIGSVRPTYRPGVTPADLSRCLPSEVTLSLRAAFPLFEQKIPGFADPETVLTGVETRSSSPVRILRDETGQASIPGIFPCGEGAGYAGGILSAAVDGIRCAEWICAAVT